jgi:hypothetical protein
MSSLHLRNIASPLAVILIFTFCLPLLSFAFTFSASKTEGISALDVCTKDSTAILQGEMGISEDFYSVPCFSTISIISEKEGYFIISLVPALSEKPPTI